MMNDPELEKTIEFVLMFTNFLTALMFQALMPAYHSSADFRIKVPVVLCQINLCLHGI